MALGPTSARDRQNRYTSGIVRFDEAQALTSGQQQQVRANIGAPGTAAATQAANGLMAAADKTAVDIFGGGTQVELNNGVNEARRAWSASMLWTWLQNRVKALLNASGTAPMFVPRAWVVFSADGNIAGAGNVQSISKLGTGRWRVTFSTNMPDVNYAIIGSAVQDAGGNDAPLAVTMETGSRQANGFIIQCRYATSGSQGLADTPSMSVAVFR